MELVNGPSLAQLVERDGPLSLEQVLRLLREALSALAHAHGSGWSIGTSSRRTS